MVKRSLLVKMVLKSLPPHFFFFQERKITSLIKEGSKGISEE